MMDWNAFKEFLEGNKTWMDEWSLMFPDEEFRRIHTMKCFQYYRLKQPAINEEWRRMVSSWLLKNWEKTMHTMNPRRPMGGGKIDGKVPFIPSFEWVDPHKGLRDEIHRMEHESRSCTKCFNSGVIMAYRREDTHQQMFCFVCNCEVGNKAGGLPENRHIRGWHQRSGEWVVDLAPVSEACPF